MRNLERYELADPALVLESHRERDAARLKNRDWLEAVRRQQFPEPIQDRYSAMYDRLILKKGNTDAAAEHIRANASGKMGNLGALGQQRQTLTRRQLVRKSSDGPERAGPRE